MVTSCLPHPLHEHVDAAPDGGRDADHLACTSEARERVDDAAHALRRVVDAVDDVARTPQLARGFLGEGPGVAGESPRFRGEGRQPALGDGKNRGGALDRAARAQDQEHDRDGDRDGTAGQHDHEPGGHGARLY